MCVAGKQCLEQVTRFDMPGFRPRGVWVRELKRFGILGSGTGPNDRIDIYATERKYWESLWLCKNLTPFAKAGRFGGEYA